MRYALIKNGVVQNVIAASPEFISDADPNWKALYDSFEEIDASQAGTCEPGSGYDPDAKVFVRPTPGKKWDPSSKQMVDDPDYTPPPKSTEERLAALESRPK